MTPTPACNYLTQLRCSLCSNTYQLGPEFLYVCPACGMQGLLDVEYDFSAARPHFEALRKHRQPRGLGRYVSLLPIRSVDNLPPILVGDTPLTPGLGLGKLLSMPRLFFKEDSRNPTASFKDRASAIAIAVARERGLTLITGASTGNAASSLAGLCASVGIKTVIFVPSSAPEAKVTQLLIYGAEVLLVEGTYDDAFELSLEASRRFGWFNRNTGYNPMCLEGKKTVSFEIWEDLGYRAPDAVFVSVGDGCIIAGIGKGFKDLLAMGLIEKLPRLYGVQAKGSSVLCRALEEGCLTPDPAASTYADSICVGEPRVASQALARVKESRGAFVVVCDDAIRKAQLQFARTTGIFAEPAAAAAIAGLQPALDTGLITPNETVVAVITGHGLKDIRGAMSALNNHPHRISKSPTRLESTLRDLNLA